MKRVLAISDEVSDVLRPERLREIDPHLVVSCGDLPFDYLEYIVTITNVPLAYVLGNHDPAPAPERAPLDVAGGPFIRPPDTAAFGPGGCTLVDGLIVDLRGVRIAGLGGSMRYSGGPHQYTEKEMRRRSRRLSRRARRLKFSDRKGVDVLVTHAPPRGVGDQSDPAHRGFESFHDLTSMLAPQVMLHGHIHPYGHARPDHRLNGVSVLNAVGYRIVELER
ncbi:MAG: metallophosphoesterase family protein [Actinomycetota bacterium]